MYRLLRPLLFLFPAELAHRLGMVVLRWLGAARSLAPRVRRRQLPDLPELVCERFGHGFPSPLGVAAGLDKDGTAASGLFALGFGFVEVGTVTPLAQPGNPKPRLFRVPADGALVNRMGFNSPGAAATAANLRGCFRPGPLAVNIGKNKATADEGAIADYVAAAREVSEVADYLVVNVSSPNTPGLRTLQKADRLAPLLAALRREVPERPLVLKFAPDLSEADLEMLCEVAREGGLAGLCATNTTLSRPRLDGAYLEGGGMSGRPLGPLARKSLQLAYRFSKGLPIIGVGGLWEPSDLLERICDGASLLQAYTALVFRGPGWVRAATLGLARDLRKSGFRSVDEAVGSDASR